MNLSEHFTLAELIQSQTAARLGLDNTPTAEHLDNLRLLCTTLLEPARSAFGPILVTSGYRAPAVDDAVPRRVPNARPSAHRQGFAADVIPLAVSKLTLARFVVAQLPFDQVILEYGTEREPAWVHVSAEPPLRKQVLRILAGTGYEAVTL